MKKTYLGKKELLRVVMMIFMICSYGFAQGKFEYKFEKGKVYKYSEITEVKTTQSMAGQEMTFALKNTTSYSIMLINVLPDGSFVLDYTMDSMKMEADNPMIPTNDDVMTELTGKKYKVVITKYGETKEIELTDKESLSEKAKAIVEQYSPKRKEFFLRFKENFSSIGDTCSFEPKVDTTNMNGIKASYSATVSLKIEGKTEKLGYSANIITNTTNSKISGSGEQQGATVTIDGTGKGNGEYYFAQKEGLMLGFKNQQNLDMTAEISAMGMSIPITINTTTTVTLVK